MATFKDSKGREWNLALDVFLLEQVESKIGVKIARLFEDNAKGLIELLAEPVQFVRVLWILAEEQAGALKVTPEQFGRALAGDCLEQAASAFVDAVADFSPSRPRRLIRAMQEAGLKVSEAMTRKGLDAIEKASATLLSSATNSAASSELTPAGAG